MSVEDLMCLKCSVKSSSPFVWNLIFIRLCNVRMLFCRVSGRRTVQVRSTIKNERQVTRWRDTSNPYRCSAHRRRIRLLTFIHLRYIAVWTMVPSKQRVHSQCATNRATITSSNATKHFEINQPTTCDSGGRSSMVYNVSRPNVAADIQLKFAWNMYTEYISLKYPTW